MDRTFLPAALVVLASCQSVATRAPRPMRPNASSEVAALFPADGPPTSDPELGRLLDSPWTIPTDIRVALLQIDHRSEFIQSYWNGWSASFGSTAGLDVASEAAQTLLGIDGVFDVAYLPSFLLADGKSIGPVREAAARYQADWVLIYSSTVRANPDDNLFKSDRVDGVCLVECALLDTRTGLIPFTARSTSRIDAKARKGERILALVQRSELEAVNAAMAKNAMALAELVEVVRSREP